MKSASRYQPSLFDQPVKKPAVVFDMVEGKRLAEQGLERAVMKADDMVIGWSERCWQLFWQWLNRKPRYFEFMVEDFRAYCYHYDLIEKPNSERAFGMLSVKAVKLNIIEFAGTRKVKNKKAHSTPANVWRKR